MRTQMQHMFSQVLKADIQRSAFNRTCTYKTTFDSGYLVPFYVDEVLPGEDYRDWETDRKSTRLNSSHSAKSRMPSSA